MRIDRGTGPLPFFAEYPYYVWGEVNYKSEGDCKRPTDRAWTDLAFKNRDTGEQLSIAVRGDAIELEGPSAPLAAALTAARTGAARVLPEDHAPRIARADAVARQFFDPNLAAFDSFGWWGGWKWIGSFATDFTAGLRVVIQSVHERRIVDPDVLPFLARWKAEPPREFHETGVAFALAFLGRLR